MPGESVSVEPPTSSSFAQAGDRFLTTYYEYVDPEDLLPYSSETLDGRARHHLSLASTLPPGTSKVDVVIEPNCSVVFVVAAGALQVVRPVTAELNRQGAPVRLLVHPSFDVVRDPTTHELRELRPAAQRTGTASALPDSTSSTETWLAIEIGRLLGSLNAADLIANIEKILGDVRAVTEDSPALKGQVADVLDSLAGFPHNCVPTVQQLNEFMAWLDGGNFILLGYCEYGLTAIEDGPDLRLRPGSVLGLLRRQNLPTSGGSALRGSRVLALYTSDLRSLITESIYLDDIRLPMFDASGVVIGERRFVGVFAPGRADQPLAQIPVIRDKIARLRDRLGFASGSAEEGKMLAGLESFPIEELFHIDEDELTRLAADILRIHQGHETKLLLRFDDFEPFMTALVFLPRQRLNAAVRLRIEQELQEASKASSMEFEVRLTESYMARIFFRALLPAGARPESVDAAALERTLINATRTWAEGLDEALRDRMPPEQAARLSALWGDAFPPSYRADFGVQDAVDHIGVFEQYDLEGTGGRPLDHPVLTVRANGGAADVPAEDTRIRLYLTAARSLSQILPLLHNLGLQVRDQRPFEILRGNTVPLFLYDLGVTYPAGVDPVATGSLLADAFGAAMVGDTESDRFDALVLQEGTGWRQVVILRSYAKYLQQLGTTNSYEFVADTFLANATATRALLGLFRARFYPGIGISERLRDTRAARAAVAEAIDAVASLDADRLLRTFLNLIEATTRTNFYRDRPYLSFKLQPSRLPGAPHPRPKFEIWVYSPRVEGVHLRFGPVARGGIRWSDRREDFRTEVLGLAKVQIVKNSVIVPTGAKGGFYPKRLPNPGTDRAAWLAEGIESYKDFLRGLLDLTDNLVQPDVADSRDTGGIRGSVGQVVPPPLVVRHDDDDYYLVVAADKGTAAFSDTANEVSKEYGYWLGDAFASGGSVGYDHKQMGITARGAWASAEQHLGELGIDPESQEFTVVGIGDMSGDVFGNGMLLSPHIRLVAAFDHRHIFLDPTPDAESSLEERRRLFNLPRSSWADYDPGLISPGGGVYPRTAKSIAIDPELYPVLGLLPRTTAMSPPELIQAILRAPVDLIFNGGIGTYVKASSETNTEVGDKANDAIRINATELRARTVVEGGNLGMTQRGRVEAALNGVLLNTDAVDNSAGVDCSDHEVNMKIFIDRMIAAGKMDAGERAGFLHSLTDDVARLVLKNNRDQNVLLLNDRALVLNWSPGFDVNWSAGFERTLDWLDKATDLDRSLEALPTTEELRARAADGRGITSPELSVLAAYAKIALAKELNNSDVVDDPWFDRVLRSYFPPKIVDRFGAELETHPLRRQIICTVLANDIINLGGITFAFRAIEETTGSAAALARAFVAVREAFDLHWITDWMSALPPEVSAAHAAELSLYVRRMLDRGTRWYLTHDHRDQPVEQALARITPAMDLRQNRKSVYLRGDDIDLGQDLLTRWEAISIPPDMALRAFGAVLSFTLLDVSLIAEKVHEPIERIADLYSAAFQRIGALRLLLRITDLPVSNRWETLSRAALRDDVYSAVADMTLLVLRTTDSGGSGPTSSTERIVAWERGHQEQLARIKDTFAEVTQPGPVDIHSISVALKLLRSLVRT
ncbi:MULTISPECIES: NAD-glutamate dehydrogenase [Arthrobacter]|uniref:NAD-glutamate dehydrogenase n=1 Tax=Arthrobacter terricola TaxID=2547396 RepID=A0A4R5KAT8_9MICC|nr:MULTISPECIES: NAD-glutamate dehydrogenase [Arthrobacter]MBT8162273.1 NAD-glutamate dehydrogenase [Arthrobacter sp. GN70]TDF92251.1 NAD-glutamate dehydrogenase [Arthrobacter terricola]